MLKRDVSSHKFQMPDGFDSFSQYAASANNITLHAVSSLTRAHSLAQLNNTVLLNVTALPGQLDPAFQSNVSHLAWTLNQQTVFAMVADGISSVLLSISQLSIISAPAVYSSNTERGDSSVELGSATIRMRSQRLNASRLAAGPISLAFTNPNATSRASRPTLSLPRKASILLRTLTEVDTHVFVMSEDLYAWRHVKTPVDHTLSALLGSNAATGASDLIMFKLTNPVTRQEVPIQGLAGSVEHSVQLLIPHGSLKQALQLTTSQSEDGDMLSLVQPLCRFWNKSSLQWSTNGCKAVYTSHELSDDAQASWVMPGGHWQNVSSDHGGEAAQLSFTLCACSHLTTFSLAASDITPQANLLTLQDVRNLTPANIMERPTTLLGKHMCTQFDSRSTPPQLMF